MQGRSNAQGSLLSSLLVQPQCSQLRCMLVGQAGIVWATETVSLRTTGRTCQEPRNHPLLIQMSLGACMEDLEHLLHY